MIALILTVVAVIIAAAENIRRRRAEADLEHERAALEGARKDVDELALELRAVLRTGAKIPAAADRLVVGYLPGEGDGWLIGPSDEVVQTADALVECLEEKERRHARALLMPPAYLEYPRDTIYEVNFRCEYLMDQAARRQRRALKGGES